MNKTFSAGKYYIGDPCYVMDKWNEIIKSTGCFGIEIDKDIENWDNGVFVYNGKNVLQTVQLMGMVHILIMRVESMGLMQV